MKTLAILLIITTCSGCGVGLTHTKYVKARGFFINRSADYTSLPAPELDTNSNKWWPNIDMNNRAVISKENTTVEFISIPHYTRMVSLGVILPLVPTWKNAFKIEQSNKLMKINNIGSTGIVIIYEGPECEDTEVTYPTDDFWKVENLTTLFEKYSDVLELKPNEFIWIKLPECEKFHLNIKINNEKYTIRFKEGSGWVWHLISV